MRKTDRVELQGKLDWEGGFDYFITGSDFAEIEDKKFHELRKAFVKAYRALEAYIYNG